MASKEIDHHDSNGSGASPDGERRGSVLFQSETKRKASIAALTANETGEIQNPLVGVPRDVLMRDVDDFANQYGLNDIHELLRKGALVAQSPELIDSLPELSAEEKQDFADEYLHRWRHPAILVSLEKGISRDSFH